MDPLAPGSRLDANHPQSGVLIPCKFTFPVSSQSKNAVTCPPSSTMRSLKRSAPNSTSRRSEASASTSPATYRAGAHGRPQRRPRRRSRREEGRRRTRRLRGLPPRASAPHLQDALPRRAQRDREGGDHAIGILQWVTPQDDVRSQARSDHRAASRLQNQDARPMACQPLIYVFDPLDLF